MNQKEVLLMSGTTLIGGGTAGFTSDPLLATISILVGCALFAYRGWLKSE